MKSQIVSFIAVGLLAACGQGEESQIQEKGTRFPLPRFSAVSLEGVVKSVTARAIDFRDAPGVVQTEVRIAFNFDCNYSFKLMTQYADRKPEHLNLYIHAIAYNPVGGPRKFCFVAAHHEETVIIPGVVYSEENVQLHSLTAYEPATITREIVGQRPAGAKIIKTARLCPDGMTCVVDGTIVTVEYQAGCANTVDQIAYKSKQPSRQDGLGDLELFLSGTEFINELSLRAFCNELPKFTKDITLINQYGTVDTIKLHNLTK